MSISVKNDDVQINREGTMVSVSTIQQSNETTSKVNKEDDTKRQLGESIIEDIINFVESDKRILSICDIISWLFHQLIFNFVSFFVSE